jgi:putative cardiolipin synthase
VLGCGCRTLDKSAEAITPTFSLPPPVAGPLVSFAAECVAETADEESSLLLVDRNEAALHWRLALIDSAERSLDFLYFLWSEDEAGWLLFERVIDAADRGVRVRILLDDLLLPPMDKFLAVLNDHPHIEVRDFNPWNQRAAFHYAEYMVQMSHLNHRMHDKAMVADSTVAISGGRNIGNEYLGLSWKSNYQDCELLSVGPVVSELAAMFDYYWNCKPVISAAALWRGAKADQLPKLISKVRAELDSAENLAMISRQPKNWTDWLKKAAPAMTAGSAYVVYDRLEGDAPEDQTTSAVLGFFPLVQEELLILNAYLIPGKAFLERLDRTTSRGVRVRILTNSLGSVNHAAVNSAYKKTRKPLLEAGAELYELRFDAQIQTLVDTPPVVSDYVGLHAKAMVGDDTHLFVGSYNLDPRSRNLNSEMGIVVKSKELSRQLKKVIETDMTPVNSWRVRLDAKGKLVWESEAGTVYTQPARNFWGRFEDFFFGILPIRNQL